MQLGSSWIFDRLATGETGIENGWRSSGSLTTRLPKLSAEMPLKKFAQGSATPQARDGCASIAGPPRDTCGPVRTRSSPNRPLTCGFYRGAGRT